MSLLSLPTELLLDIGRRQVSVLNLILTCKALHQALYHLVFSEITLSCPEREYDPDIGDDVAPPGNLYDGLRALGAMSKHNKQHWVHKLVIKSRATMLPPLLTEPNAWRENRKIVNLMICNALFECNRLRELEYALVETKARTINVMKMLPSLKSLKLSFLGKYTLDWPEFWPQERSHPFVDGTEDYNESEDDEDHDFEFRPVSLQGFKNLSLLHLNNLYRCLSPFAQDIAQVLLESPGLSDLRLDTIPDGNSYIHCNNPQHAPQDYRDHSDFWQRLCERYTRVANGQKIKLVSLHLGSGVYLDYFPKRDSVDAASKDDYITSAFDLTGLKRFTFSNYSLGNLRDLVIDHTLNAKWELLETATNLTEIGVVFIQRPMLTFLQSPNRCKLCLLRLYDDPSEGEEWDLYEELQTLPVVTQAKVEIRYDIDI